MEKIYNMQVLVIDDEIQVREMLNKILSSVGYTVLKAGDGVEGLKIMSQNPEVELVITDLIMPEKEGLETIRDLKSKYPKTKILAISGGGKIDANDYLVVAKSMGAHKTLSKPFTTDELLDAINEIKEN